MTTPATQWDGILALGQDRPGDLLVSLDPEHYYIREAVVAAGMHLEDAIFTPHSPIQKHLNERINNAQPGDFVFIRDRYHYPERTDLQRLRNSGYLLLRRLEWCDTEEEWEECRHEYRNQARPSETVTYLQHGSNAGDITRWHDASKPIAIPTHRTDDWIERFRL